MKKRLGSILLTLAMLLTMVPAVVVPARAESGTATTGSGTSSDPYVVHSWLQLKSKMGTGTEDVHIKLGEDVVDGVKDSSSYLTVPNSKSVYLDLNGHIIDRALTAPIENGYVILVKSKLILSDSAPNNTHDGVYSLLPKGGIITGGNNNGDGGGLFLNPDSYRFSTLSMSGGTIINNSSNGCGGGIYLKSGSDLIIGSETGATITGNSASKGGGIYATGSSGKFQITEMAYISGNTNDNSGRDNVYLADDKTITLNTGLNNTTPIGVTMETPGVFTKGSWGIQNFSRFVSDNDDYSVALMDNEQLQLIAPIEYPLWVGGTQVTDVNSSDVLGNGTVSYDAATNTLTLNGANITGAYDYTYTLGDYTYIRKAGIYSGGALNIDVERNSTITGAATTEARNNSSGIYTGGNLTMTVAEGETLNVTGGSTVYDETGSYGIYVGSTYGTGSFTFSGPGTLNASGADTAAYRNYGIYTRAAVTISGGTVNAAGHTASSASVGIHAETGRITITGGSLTAISDRENTNNLSIGITSFVNINGGCLMASGYNCAIDGGVANTIVGTGWVTTDGSGTAKRIEVPSEDAPYIYYDSSDNTPYKRIQFPAPNTCTVTYATGKGSGTMDAGTATEGIPFTLPDCTFAAPEYKAFAGWKIGDTDTIVSAGETYTFTGDTTVTATWITSGVAASYEIYVRTLAGSILTLGVNQNVTIGQLKSLIDDRLDISPAQQNLAYQTTLLEDARTLGWYNIQKEATVNMVYIVTVTNDGNGTGSASPAFGGSGTEVALAAAPASGFHFKEWQVVSGGVTVADNSFTIGAADVVIRAVFEADAPTTYAVTINNGTGGGDYAVSASVTITANNPEAGKRFKEWTGADGLTFTSGSATTATATFTMPANAVNLAATYEDIPTYTLIVTAPTFDAVTAGYAQPAAKPLTITSIGNSEATISSVALSGTDAGSFTLVNGTNSVTANGTNTTYTVQPAANLTAGTYSATVTVTYDGGATATGTVTFTVSALPTYTVTVTNDGHGTGSASPPSGTAGTPVTLTATPASSYHFKEWQVVSGGVTVTGNTFTIGNTDVEIKAVFEADAPAIIHVTGVTLNKTSTTLAVGATETLTATVTPSGATNKAVTWSSGNESVATVANGVVTAVAAGSAAITVTTEDGSKQATCSVTVGKAAPSLTAPTARTGLTYTGEAQALVNAGSATGGTLQYKLGESGSYGASVPTAKDAGGYTVYYRVVGDADHSDIAEQSVPVTISPKEIGLTWAGTSFVYDGAAHAPTAAATELIGMDSCTVSVSGAQTNVGTYTATASVLSNGNYKLPGAATQSFSITPAPLTVKADTIKKAYGAEAPALTYTVEGLRGTDRASVVLTGALATTTSSASNAGDYPITQGTLAANANYTLSFTGATLTILKAAQAAPAKGAGYTITGTTLSVDTASANPNAGDTTHYEIFDGATIHTSGSVTMAANKTYYVRWGGGTNYNPSPYTEIPAEVGVTVMAAPATMGSVTTAGLTGGKCRIGSTVTVTAIPSSGCEFINWQKPDGSSASTNAAYSFTATESVILIAAFKEKDKAIATLPTVENKTYTGAVQSGVKTQGTGCTITGTQSATDAGTYTITATLAPGYDVWPDGTTAPKTLTWRVNEAAQTAPVVEVTDTTISVTIPSGKTVKYSTDRKAWNSASASMTGMAAGSYYFYTVGDDNHYDSPITVAYVSAPTITATTIQPSALTATGVMLNGTAEPKAYANGAYLSAVGFEYKAVGGSWIAVDGTIGGAFNASLSGLAEDTDYVCRAVVTLKDGTTKTYGAEITFHTPKAAPSDDGKIKAVIQSESEADTRMVFVSVERGNDVIATSDTVALNGNSGAVVSFDKLPYGHYNVVVHTVDGDYTATNMLSVEGSNEVATRFTIPIGKLATVVEVKTEETPKTAVEGLNEILTSEDKNNAAAGSQDVEIRLEVEKKPEDAADGASAIKGLDDNKIDTYLDMSLFKTTTDLDAQGNATSIETMDIGSTNTEVVEIAIPYANTSRSGLTMYRYHNALAEILTMLTAKPVGAFLDGTYYVDRTGGYIFLYASGFSTYAIGFAESAVYTVTFDANGGTGTMASQSIHGTAALNANAFTRSGYTFNGWNTAADGSGTSYANAANITPTADLTLYAQWKSNSPGSDTPSGGNDGYFPSTTITGATETVPVSGESGSVSVSVTVSGVTATIKAPTTAELNKVIGESVKTGDIVMDLRELNRDIATASIPAETIRAIEKAVSDPGNDASSLTIKLTDGSVTFDAKALAAVAEQMKGSNLQLHLDGVGTSGLNAAQQAAIKAMDVQAVYDIYLTSNGVRITDFKDGSATVTVAYTLKSGQMGSGVDVWYVADGGKMEEIPTRYDSKEATFTVEHFSNYVVVYDEERTASGALNGYADCPRGAACPISTFKDTNPTEWYHDGVHWAIENGVMNGVGDGLFLPNGTTTRAQVAAMLYRLAGSPQVSGESVFTDVAESMWYTDAIRWATTHGVVTGFERDGMTVFDPDGSITREQLAAMIYRYAKLNGQGFTGAWMFLLDYPDAADVSEWASEAVHWMVMRGIINGMDGRLNPQSSATRAQTATMFMRYYAESVK